MTKEDIISKIKEQAYENVNKKLEEEQKRTEEKINKEIDIVEEILGYIANKMIFKKPKYGEYILVDEKMFFEDYSSEPKNSWSTKLAIWHERQRKYDSFITVNGEDYYDIRYIINDYEETFKNYTRRLNDKMTGLRDIERKVEELKQQEPKIKALIEQYKKVEIIEPDEVEE